MKNANEAMDHLSELIGTVEAAIESMRYMATEWESRARELRDWASVIETAAVKANAAYGWMEGQYPALFLDSDPSIDTAASDSNTDSGGGSPNPDDQSKANGSPSESAVQDDIDARKDDESESWKPDPQDPHATEPIKPVADD